jgi:hypothetical protein
MYPFKRVSAVLLIPIIICSILLSGCRGGLQTPPATEKSQTEITKTPPDGLPAPQLTTTSWKDRSVYRDGLIKTDQTILDQSTGMSIYHLKLNIANDYRRLDGSEEVLFTNPYPQSLDKVVFHLYPNVLGGKMSVDHILVNGKNATTTLVNQNSILEVKLEKPLDTGGQVVVSMDYSVDIPAGSEVTYNTFCFQNNILTLPQAYPLLSVFENGTWHEEIPAQWGDVTYAESSYYEVIVTAPEKFNLATSGRMVNQVRQNGKQTDTFAAGPVREFYMTGSVDYISRSQKSGDITINSYSLSTEPEVAKTSLNIAVKALKAYDLLIGEYPFTEFDVVSTPTEAMGVEYPGIVAINRDLGEAGSQSASGMDFYNLGFTITHEVGHQWFYSTVGDDQQDYPWLDESLTQYITWKNYEKNGETEAAEGLRGTWLTRWDKVGRDKMPIGYPVSSYSQDQYSAIIYGRGPLFFEALAQKMGEAEFDAFLRDYYSANRFGIATPEILQKTAEKACSCNLNSLFREWVIP